MEKSRPALQPFKKPSGGRGSYTWEHATHSNIRAQKRNLKRMTRWIFESKDPKMNAAGTRVIQAVASEPDPEFSTYHLFAAAMRASEDTGVSWVDCMNILMDKFDNMERPDATTPQTTPETKTPTVGDQRNQSNRRSLRGFLQKVLSSCRGRVKGVHGSGGSIGGYRSGSKTT